MIPLGAQPRCRYCVEALTRTGHHVIAAVEVRARDVNEARLEGYATLRGRHITRDHFALHAYRSDTRPTPQARPAVSSDLGTSLAEDLA